MKSKRGLIPTYKGQKDFLTTKHTKSTKKDKDLRTDSITCPKRQENSLSFVLFVCFVVKNLFFEPLAVFAEFAGFAGFFVVKEV
ncbi:MAG: hypothetical protein HQK89_00655 [Nitrospirae bacterium]|nr:hypothetical protein [Nitrospirota bacterium]